MDDSSSDCCWVCLCGVEETGKQLVQCCKCPRPVHRECLARWQLQKAGSREERYCRFCFGEFPDWKDSLTPGDLKPSTPVMAVSVRGKVHKLRVKPGPEGKEDFKRQVRQLLGYSEDMEFDVIFECKTPHNGEKVQLHGFSAFDAATHCAAVSAAKRLKNKPPKPTPPPAPAHTSTDGSLQAADSGSVSSGLTSSSAPDNTAASLSSGVSSNSSTVFGTPNATSTASIGSALSPSFNPAGGAVISFANPAVPPQLQAQYQQFMRRQHELYMAQHYVQQQQQQEDQQLQAGAGQATLSSAADVMSAATTATEVQASIGGLPGRQRSPAASHHGDAGAAWGTAGTADGAAGAVAPLPAVLTPARRSASIASDAAAAVLTAAKPGSMSEQGSGSRRSSSSSAGGRVTFSAAAAAADPLRMSCPLPLSTYASSSSADMTAATTAASAATDGESVWANCASRSMSEPLQLMTAVNNGENNARAAGANSGVSHSSIGEQYVSSIGCMGTFGGQGNNANAAMNKTSKLAAWFKLLGNKKGSKTGA